MGCRYSCIPARPNQEKPDGGQGKKEEQGGEMKKGRDSTSDAEMSEGERHAQHNTSGILHTVAWDGVDQPE